MGVSARNILDYDPSLRKMLRLPMVWAPMTSSSTDKNGYSGLFSHLNALYQENVRLFQFGRERHLLVTDLECPNTMMHVHLVGSRSKLVIKLIWRALRKKTESSSGGGGEVRLLWNERLMVTQLVNRISHWLYLHLLHA